MANSPPREEMATSYEELVEISASESSTLCSVSSPSSSATFSQRYEIIAQIGHGGQGSVCRVKRRSDGRLFACKTMRILEVDSTELIRDEVRILEHLKASSVAGVVGLEEVIVDTTFWHIILELCSCSLHDRIYHTKGLSHPEAARLIWNLAKVVQELHRVGVIHRDLKPPNVLLTFTGSSDYQVKVADFGLAAMFPDGQECGTGCILGSVGTRKYYAPEVARKDYHDKSVDVWGLGLILYEAVSGRLAFSNRDSDVVVDRLKWAESPGELLDWSGVGNDVKKFIMEMLCVDPKKRLTTEEIQRHPWVLKHCPDLVPKTRIIQMKRVNGRWLSNRASQGGDGHVKQNELKQKLVVTRRKQEIQRMEQMKLARYRERALEMKKARCVKLKRAREDSFPSLSTWVKSAKLKLVNGTWELRYPEPVPPNNKDGSPPMKMTQLPVQFVNGEWIAVR